MNDTAFLQQIQSAFEPAESRDNGRKQVGAVVTAIRVLALLSDTPAPQRMTTISRQLDIAASSCFNILRTLAQEGLVTFDRKAKTYAAGVGLISIARNYLTPGGGLRAVRPLLEEFARSREVTVVIWRRSGQHMTVVTYVDNGSALRVHIETGARFPLLGGAMGRVLAANGGLSPREVKQHFAKVQWEHPISIEAFLSEAEETRQRGWAFDPGLFHKGIATVSTAIDEGHGGVDAVLSATMFPGQYDSATVAAIAEELCALAKLLASVKVSRSF